MREQSRCGGERSKEEIAANASAARSITLASGVVSRPRVPAQGSEFVFRVAPVSYHNLLTINAYLISFLLLLLLLYVLYPTMRDNKMK